MFTRGLWLLTDIFFVDVAINQLKDFLKFGRRDLRKYFSLSAEITLIVDYHDFDTAVVGRCFPFVAVVVAVEVVVVAVAVFAVEPTVARDF